MGFKFIELLMFVAKGIFYLSEVKYEICWTYALKAIQVIVDLIILPFPFSLNFRPIIIDIGDTFSLINVISFIKPLFDNSPFKNVVSGHECEKVV
jgi:hypothetical protein